jgi:glycosyltransferase involved in cell wall biosynthesis
VHGGGDGVERWMSPLKLFEYMSYAKPIIASDLPVLREVLEDGRTALLAAPDDPEPWVAALERLRDDAGLRQKLGAEALAHFEGNYTWTSRARRVIEAVGTR